MSNKGSRSYRHWDSLPELPGLCSPLKRNFLGINTSQHLSHLSESSAMSRGSWGPSLGSAHSGLCYPWSGGLGQFQAQLGVHSFQKDLILGLNALVTEPGVGRAGGGERRKVILGGHHCLPFSNLQKRI